MMQESVMISPDDPRRAWPYFTWAEAETAFDGLVASGARDVEVKIMAGATEQFWLVTWRVA